MQQLIDDDLQNTAGQLMLFQQKTKVEDRGLARNSIQVQSCKLPQDRGLVE